MKISENKILKVKKNQLKIHQTKATKANKGDILPTQLIFAMTFHK